MIVQGHVQINRSTKFFVSFCTARVYESNRYTIGAFLRTSLNNRWRECVVQTSEADMRQVVIDHCYDLTILAESMSKNLSFSSLCRPNMNSSYQLQHSNKIGHDFSFFCNLHVDPLETCPNNSCESLSASPGATRFFPHPLARTSSNPYFRVVCVLTCHHRNISPRLTMSHYCFCLPSIS